MFPPIVTQPPQRLSRSDNSWGSRGESSYQPFRDGQQSWGKSFNAPDDDLPEWTRRSNRGSNPTPLHNGAYYKAMGGPIPGNRAPSHAGAWMQAPVEELHESPMRRTERALEGGRQSVSTEWLSARAATAAARRAAVSAASSVIPVLTVPGASDTGLFGGITGTASASDSDESSLWGSHYDAT
jgi:hypothetical protein